MIWQIRIFQPQSPGNIVCIASMTHKATCLNHRSRFYPRWMDWEIRQALKMGYTLNEGQLAEDWAEVLNLASKPGASLEQIHVFCLAHVLRRPIIVYGVKYVKSWRGENLGFARFEGEEVSMPSLY